MMTIYGRAITDDDMEIIASYMDDEIREQVHAEIAPCSNGEFIKRYLEVDESLADILEREFEFKEV